MLIERFLIRLGFDVDTVQTCISIRRYCDIAIITSNKNNFNVCCSLLRQNSKVNVVPVNLHALEKNEKDKNNKIIWLVGTDILSRKMKWGNAPNVVIYDIESGRWTNWEVSSNFFKAFRYVFNHHLNSIHCGPRYDSFQILCIELCIKMCMHMSDQQE